MAVLHFLAMFGPFLYYIPFAFVTGTPKTSYVVCSTLVISFILLVVSFVIGVTHRAGIHKTIFWVLLLGLTFAVKNQLTLIIVMALASILDEIVFIPLKDKYKRLYETNKEIDKRGDNGQA